MSRENKGKGFTRRDFVKVVGIAGIAAAGAGVTGAIPAPEKPGGANNASATNARDLETDPGLADFMMY